MLAVTAVTALGTMVLLRGDISAYADVVTGWQRSDLIYGFGKPTTERSTGAATVLVHRRGDLSITSTLGPGGVSHITCDPIGVAAACPPLVGVGGGETETEVWRRLGPPTRMRYAGADKFLDYDGLGLTYRLQRFVVREVGLRPMSGLLPFLGRWARVTLP